MLENNDLEIVDTKLEEEKKKKELEEKKKKELEEMQVIDENSEIIDGIEIIDDGSDRNSKRIKLLIFIFILLIGCGVLYFFYDKYKKENTIVVDTIVIDASKDDFGQYFMNILNNHNYSFDGNKSYDITINYGKNYRKINDNIDLSINFSSKNCYENEDPNCSLFNKSNKIKLIINGKDYKYYDGYNNSYDVIEGILKHGYIALLYDGIYVVNNSDTEETYGLDEVSKPNIIVYSKAEENDSWYDSYKEVENKYIENNNIVECPISYDKENNILSYCYSKYYDGKTLEIKKEIIKGILSITWETITYNAYSYSDYQEKINPKENIYDDSKLELNNKGKTINEIKKDGINDLFDFIENETNDGTLRISGFTPLSIFSDKEININNIDTPFVNEYIFYLYEKYDSTYSHNGVYDYDSINNLYKKTFNTENNFSKEEYDRCKYHENENKIICESYGTLGVSLDLTTRIENFETDGDYLYIYMRTLYDTCKQEFLSLSCDRYIYARPNETKLLARKQGSLNNISNEEYNKLFEQGQLYKFTFKKNEDNKYYWVSTEPI